MNTIYEGADIMKLLGLDIGTTSISAVVYDTAQGILDTSSVKNDSFLSGESWERIQEPCMIEDTVCALLTSLLRLHPDIAALGVTGQMHGILYLDVHGEPVSPLYTWQDGRGDLLRDEYHSWAESLSLITGHSLSTGYGLVTHFYNLHHQLVPENAVTLCTIGDYIAMRLSGSATPVIDPTNAASLGLYDVENSCFSSAALAAADIDPSILPEQVISSYLGTGPWKLPVYAAIGDNQASYLGATAGRMDAVLVNIGTGGQVSVYSPSYLQAAPMEVRPFPGGGYLLVGASLCGGRSYALLEKFFRDTVKMVTGLELDAYAAMSHILDDCRDLTDAPIAVTTFQGTRKDPSCRGAFTQISENNFTPAHFVYSVMRGIAQELYDYFPGYVRSGGNMPTALIGSGNGLRKNQNLCRIIEEVFGCPLTLSGNEEEAACGAAIYTASHMQ